MNREDLVILARGFGEPLAQLTEGVAHIVHALKSQPGFDKPAFERDIRERLEKIGPDSVTGILLQSLI